MITILEILWDLSELIRDVNVLREASCRQNNLAKSSVPVSYTMLGFGLLVTKQTALCNHLSNMQSKKRRLFCDPSDGQNITKQAVKEDSTESSALEETIDSRPIDLNRHPAVTGEDCSLAQPSGCGLSCLYTNHAGRNIFHLGRLPVLTEAFGSYNNKRSLIGLEINELHLIGSDEDH
ncbi:hypothetical protein EYF80_041636 [Liparis tanakae]|uniref:Uncharacterized protein n=1 Tax=Liparis tanakae TaxID=230148 RepID=A0A4Z2G3M4_9TELE|nr:hypothetical protein EYF80_041636 [Liparis tanakae]